MEKEYDLEYRMTKISLFQVCGSEYLASVIFSGACERYPGLKFVLGGMRGDVAAPRVEPDGRRIRGPARPVESVACQ